MALASTDKAGGGYRKPAVDVYTVLLAVALAALLAAMAYLYLDMTVDQMQLTAPRVSTTAAPAAYAALDGVALPGGVSPIIADTFCCSSRV